MTGAIDLPEAELALVHDILRAHLPSGARAWVFGSRATGAARRYSDLDLALEWEQALGFDRLAEVADALSESDLPFKVDLLDLRSVDPAFRAAIEADMVPLPF